MPSHATALALITCAAAVVNGAIGYGFSSITVPVALLFLTNRTLNPALVLIAVPLNAYVVWVNRASLRLVAPRVLPIAIGLLPGTMIGTAIVSRVSPPWVKLSTFAALVPFVLAQAAGYRRPIKAERFAGALFGLAVGVLYAVTTISGPPLAILLNNQGFAARDFRAAIALVRVAEASMTTVSYWSASMYGRDNLLLLPVIVPSVAIGIPIGVVMIRRLRPETFRRLCMSFDAWVVGFGLSGILRSLQIVPATVAWTVFALVVAIDVWLLYRFFTTAGARR